MSKSRKKNRSAREKQLARERARRARRSQEHPLHALQPPFAPYREWITVPDEAADMTSYPVPAGMTLDQDAKCFADMLIKLGPLYAGRVPMAALYLEMQIQRGFVDVALTGSPDQYAQVPLAELTADCSPPGDTGAEDDAATALHGLHFHGALIMDDNHLMHPALG